MTRFSTIQGTHEYKVFDHFYPQLRLAKFGANGSNGLGGVEKSEFIFFFHGAGLYSASISLTFAPKKKMYVRSGKMILAHSV